MNKRGFTLIEVIIALAVLGIMTMIGLPSMAQWLQNAQVRTAAETTLNGLQLARSEAIRRNTSVRFTLTSDMSASCATSASGADWVVSLDDPTARCDVAASDTIAPRAIQKKESIEGSPTVALTATGGASVIFDPMGRPWAGGANRIDIRNPLGGTCTFEDPGGNMRCLSVLVDVGGQLKLCDPAITDTTNPGFCA